MKLTIFLLLLFISINLFAAAPKEYQQMTCIELLEQMKVLEEYKRESERGNYEGIEKLLLATTGHFYLGNRRDDGTQIDISKEIKEIKKYLTTCNPY